jgi:probable rRNA maturation factor
MEISIRNRQRAIKTVPAGIERVLRAALKHLSSGSRVRGRNLASGLSFDPLKASLGVTLVGDREMRSLNLAYRGKDKTTDVLSFSQMEGLSFGQRAVELGDIVISPAQAQRQAVERCHSLNQEMRILLIHGLLHLIGYDHEKNSYQAGKMRIMEKELLDAVTKVGR